MTIKSVLEDTKKFLKHLGLSEEFVLSRIETGANPKGLSISSDGKFVYVVERMEDQISIIDTDKMQIVSSIDLGGPSRVTYTRRGGQLFSNAGHTFHNQYSCYTCHPDGHDLSIHYSVHPLIWIQCIATIAY